MTGRRPAIVPGVAGMLVVQIVDLPYGKEHRGAAAAQARARAPLGLPLPISPAAPGPLGSAQGLIHQCRMSPAGALAGDAIAELQVRDGAVIVHHFWELRPGADGVTLHRYHGAPLPRLLALPAGRWARARWNSREHSYDDSWYRELTMNFGAFTRPPDATVFVGEPDHTLDLRRDLLRLSRRRVRR